MRPGIRMNHESLTLAIANTLIGAGLANMLVALWSFHVPVWILAGLGTILFGAISTVVNLWIKDNWKRISSSLGIDPTARRKRLKKPLGLDE